MSQLSKDQDSFIGLVTRLQATKSWSRSLILYRAKRYFPSPQCPDRFLGPHRLLSNGNGVKAAWV
jgi:hypothetical protein